MSLLFLYCYSPPTVSLSTKTVGMPHVTAQLCPSLPQVHVPLSMRGLLPTIDMAARASGPLPMTLMSLIGVVSLPSSISQPDLT